MRRLKHGTWIALTFFTVDVSAQEALEWLDRMNRAVEELNYRGTFVHVLDDAFETLNVIHRNENGVIGERIVSVDGVGREIIRQADEVRCILPDQRVVLIDNRQAANPLVSALPDGKNELEPHYELTLYSTARVANRTTQVLEIKPRDDLRYGYMLWLDRETAMPLRSQLTDSAGTVVEEIRFADIEYVATIPAAELEPTIDTRGFTLLRPAQTTPLAEANLWRATGLPSGPTFGAATQGPIAGSDHPVEHYVYSDGLATISVFIESPEAEAEVAEGYSNAGSTNAYSATVSGRKVTVMGEVPRQTVRSIALSLSAQ